MMLSTQSIKFLIAFAILFASCRASRNTATVAAEEVKPAIAVAVSSGNFSKETPGIVTDEPFFENHFSKKIIAEEALPETSVASANTTTKKRITSFTQMKEMARTGEIAMSKKDFKTLTRLEKHYKGNYDQFRADSFEFTDKAKIIGGIGVLGLLLAIITGSAFGWFLFVVAALAFLLRYLNIIAF